MHADAATVAGVLGDLVGAASLVESNWEGGGLAEAVRFLLARRDEARAFVPVVSAKGAVQRTRDSMCAHVREGPNGCALLSWEFTEEGDLTPVDRAEYIRRLLAHTSYGEAGDGQDSLTDLLTDCLHWALEEGLDFDTSLDRARAHCIEERRERGA